MADPTFAQLGREEAFNAVHAELDHFVQAAGLPVHRGDSYDDAAHFRRATIARLQQVLPRTVPGSIRAQVPAGMYADADMAPVVAKIERNVLACTIQAAHESPELRPVITKDRSGREMVEYYGGNFSWMNQFRDKPRLMTRLGD